MSGDPGVDSAIKAVREVLSFPGEEEMAQVQDEDLRVCEGTTKDAGRRGRSLLAKFKDKAKRLKRRLSRKKSSAGDDGLEEKRSHGRDLSFAAETSSMAAVCSPETAPGGGEEDFIEEPPVPADKHVLPVAGDSTAPFETTAEVEFAEAETGEEGLLSVKEYLLQKLEPGEEDKALSELITAAMSPRKEKLEAIASLFSTPASSLSASSSPPHSL